MKTVFVGIDKLTEDIFAFSFEKPRNFTYIAGQFIELHLPHNNPDSRGEKRWFTLSSAPNEAILTITTKLAQKPSTFKSKLFDLSIGDEVSISEPLGDFVMPRNLKKPLLFIAGGIGVTPFRSMCKSLEKNKLRTISMLYSATSSKQFVYEDILKSVSEVQKFTRPITATQVSAKASDLGRPLVYISGPEAMVESLYKDLKPNFSQSQLLCDYFHNYT